MSREDLISDFPEIENGATQEDFEAWVKSQLDDMEERVNFIKDKLDINSVHDLSEVGAAYEAAEKLAAELY